MHRLRILIIEDEAPARERLIRLVKTLPTAGEIVGACASCAEARAWMETNRAPDVMLCDIRLSDGSALSLFETTPPPCPIIFCTAYDKYVMEALELGGVDYLLKPIEGPRLEKALAKVQPQAATQSELAALRGLLEGMSRPSARRFLVRRAGAFVSVALADVAYFASEHKLTTLVERSGPTSYLDETLTSLAAELPTFFRANRSHLISRDAVVSFRPHSRGRIALELRPAADTEVLVSPKNVEPFKAWLSGRHA